MASNLTRDEARERARLLTVQSYQVDLDLTGGETTFGSVTTVRFTLLAARRAHVHRPDRAGGHARSPERGRGRTSAASTATGSR